MKCPKCYRWIEEGSESHAACGWNVHRAAARQEALKQMPLIDAAEVQESLRKHGLERKPGETEAEHIAKIKAFARRTVGKMCTPAARRGNRDWARAIEADWKAGKPVSIGQRESAENALGRKFVRDGEEAPR